MGVRLYFKDDVGIDLKLKNGAGNDELTLVAKLGGEIDHHTAKAIREEIDETVENSRPKLLKLDFGDVHFMDSSGIGLIMGRYKLITILGGKLKVVNIPKRLERMIRLSGLVKLNIFED